MGAGAASKLRSGYGDWADVGARERLDGRTTTPPVLATLLDSCDGVWCTFGRIRVLTVARRRNIGVVRRQHATRVRQERARDAAGADSTTLLI